MGTTKYENKYSKKSYASYILGYVKKHLSTLDTKTAVLTYDAEPIVKLMTDEEIEVWEREVLDANAYEMVTTRTQNTTTRTYPLFARTILCGNETTG